MTYNIIQTLMSVLTARVITEARVLMTSVSICVSVLLGGPAKIVIYVSMNIRPTWLFEHSVCIRHMLFCCYRRCNRFKLI